MRFTLATTLRGLKTDALVLGWFERQKLASHPAWAGLSLTAKQAIQKQLKRPGVSLEWGSQTVVQLPKGPWANIVVVGLGQQADWTARRNRLVTRRVMRTALTAHWAKIVFSFQDLSSEGTARAVENAVLATYEYRAYRQTPTSGWPEVKQVVLVAKHLTAEHQAAVKRGLTIATLVNHARDLANTPGGKMTPRTLAAAAVTLAKGRKLQVRVLTTVQLEKLKMGALLGVGKGSAESPRLIVMEYHGAPKTDKPIVFVGKGITFDSGGYNLKPSNSMAEMHMDMSGGAAVMSAMAALADLRLPLNAVAIIPAAENMVSGSGFRPGDILTSMSGVHIEVGNTDAEGRLVLADGLAYAEKFYHPAIVVDVATLTGAAVVALGQEAAALFTKDDALRRAGQEIGEVSGDYVWPMPFWEEYDGLVKATFGDVTNSGKSRWGGAIEGAVFLSKFVKRSPWIHLDIAPTMSSVEGQALAPGATGSGTRWLIECARRLATGQLPTTR
ncbi:MAG: leucyl aminopeptidase [Candidatus Kerfeldbacteria bacterium]|nr:leucyl aminopeptidase [Candidatus Kerfeldbacteria bacterium]